MPRRDGASHLDDDRWRRDGPRGEAEASQLVSAGKTAIEAFQGASSRLSKIMLVA